MPMRNEIEALLSGIRYPASRHDLFVYARERGASQGILGVISRLPEWQYNQINDVIDGLNQVRATQ